MNVLILLTILVANLAAVVGQVTTTTDAGVVHVKSGATGGKCDEEVTLTDTVTYEYDIDIDLIDTFIDLPIETLLNAIKPDPVKFEVSATVPKEKEGTLYAVIELETAVSNNYISVLGVNILWATVTVTGPKGTPTGVIRDLKDLDCSPTPSPTNTPTRKPNLFPPPLGFDINYACQRMSTIRCHQAQPPSPPLCFDDIFTPITGGAPFPPSTLDKCDLQKIIEFLQNDCPPEEDCDGKNTTSTSSTNTSTESSSSSATGSTGTTSSSTGVTSSTSTSSPGDTSSMYTGVSSTGDSSSRTSSTDATSSTTVSSTGASSTSYSNTFATGTSTSTRTDSSGSTGPTNTGSIRTNTALRGSTLTVR